MTFKSVEHISSFPSKGDYLLLINVEAIPHLAVISDGYYYSLHHDGAKIGLNGFRLSRMINNGRKIILCPLPHFNCQEFKNILLEETGMENTCLQPFMAYYQSNYPTNSWQTVMDMILATKLPTDKCSFINIETDTFQLKNYNKKDVLDYIHSIKDMKHA